jgi:hypothetical protein
LQNIDVVVSVYFKDRPPVTVTKRIKIVAVLLGLVPALPAVRTTVTQDQKDLRLFRRPPRDASVNAWEGRVSASNPLIRYEKTRANAATIQLIFADGKLRRLIDDVDSDGFVDFELWQPTNEKLLKAMSRKATRLLDWLPMADSRK